MARGADIPYQLRPNKFIDRQIFLELLGRVVLEQRDGKYVYISMGGKHLVDQESAYRRIGIKSLFSFDGDPAVVERMICNRPMDSAVCVEMMAASLAGEIDSIFERFPGAENLAVWLDYTDPAKRLAQLQEFAQVLKRVRAGDVVRITMNADDRTLPRDWQKAQSEGPAQYRAFQLRSQIGDYFQSKIERIPESGLPIALAAGVALAVSEAEEETDVRFLPVLLTTYADGQRMLTATILALGQGETMPGGLVGWEFFPADWSSIIEISAPDLSIREKAAIDQHLTKEPWQIIEAIGFQPASELDDAYRALASYKRLHRFYPTFYAVGIQ